MVSQDYSTDADHKVYVIIGNSALIKCQIPSFVADFISVASWVDNDGVEYFPSNSGTFLKKPKIVGHTRQFFQLGIIFQYFFQL